MQFFLFFFLFFSFLNTRMIHKVTGKYNAGKCEANTIIVFREILTRATLRFRGKTLLSIFDAIRKEKTELGTLVDRILDLRLLKSIYYKREGRNASFCF
jgi:hypothetical protein